MLLPDLENGIAITKTGPAEYVIEPCLAPAPTPTVPRLALTYPEAGLAIGVSESTIKRMVKAGDIRSVTIAGKLRRISVEEIQRILHQ